MYVQKVVAYVERGFTSSTCISCSIGMRDSSPPNIGAGRPPDLSGVCGVCACLSEAAAASRARRSPSENTATERTRFTSAALARERLPLSLGLSSSLEVALASIEGAADGTAFRSGSDPPALTLPDNSCSVGLTSGRCCVGCGMQCADLCRGSSLNPRTPSRDSGAPGTTSLRRIGFVGLTSCNVCSDPVTVTGGSVAVIDAALGLQCYVHTISELFSEQWRSESGLEHRRLQMECL